jgi:predicted small secreted protein
MKKITLILLMGLVFTITGCETMKGLGSDIQKAGKAIEKKAAN